MDNFKLFLEFNIPTNNDGIDPALLTFKEYYDLINPRDKYHSSESYDFDLSNLNSSNDKNYSKEYPKLINTITRKGLVFEVRAKLIDKYVDNKYTKYDEHDNPIRTDGELQYYTPEELKNRGMKRYDYEFAIIDKVADELVGYSTDEWGAVLIVVAKEYRGFGLGEILTKLTRKYLPLKDSGGFTPQGLNAFKKSYTNQVREYLTTGVYNSLLKSGKISLKRIKDIIASSDIKLHQVKSKLKFEEEPSMYKQDKSQWLVFSENHEFIIYDKRLVGVYKEELDYWNEKLFIGMMYVSPGYDHKSTRNIIHTFGGIDDEVKKSLMSNQLAELKKHNETLMVSEDLMKYIDKSTVNIKDKNNDGFYEVILKEPALMSFEPLIKKEKKFRKQFDRYKEFQYFIMETATAIWD